jgi:replicative DNA helicase
MLPIVEFCCGREKSPQNGTGDELVVSLKAAGDLRLHLLGRGQLVALEKRVEDALGPDGELDAIREWAGKYVGAVARIAGLLHLAEYDPRQPVSPDTIAAAERLGDYYKASAINAFIEMGTDEVTAEAMYLLERIRTRGERDMSERNMQRAAKRFKTVAEMRPALNRLVAHRYLVPLPPADPTGGRPASPKYRVAEAI